MIKEHGPSKTVILIGVLGTVGLLILGGAVWFFVFRTPPQGTESPTPIETETPAASETPMPTLQPPPSPLIRTDRTDVRRTNADENLRDTLRGMVASDTERALITHIAFAKEDGSYYSFPELTDRLGMRIPDAILGTLDGSRYTFIATRNDLGPSAGFIVETSDPDALRAHLAEWEQTLESDMEPILVSGRSNVTSFTDGVFEEISFRFLHDVNRGIAYVVLDGKLIITTSRDLFRTTVSRLQAPPESK